MQAQTLRPVPPRAPKRRPIAVRELLEWAFSVEHAQVTYDELTESAGFGVGFAAKGNEARIEEALALGRRQGEGVRVDRSFGGSDPAHDAEMVATVMRKMLDWDLALIVAEHARAGSAPEWDLGEPQLVPQAWGRRNHLGQMAKADVLCIEEMVVRGRKRRRKVEWVPCRWCPDPARIAAARDAYRRWHGGLALLAEGLRTVKLERHRVTHELPPAAPWEETC